MFNRRQAVLVFCVFFVASAFSRTASDSDQKLAADFWAWRARTGQYTADDVTRIERPRGVLRDWSAAGVEKQRNESASFEERWKQLEDPHAQVPQKVDHRLIGSALARVRWELDILNRWQRDPNFYLEQTLTPVGEALTVPGPYNEGQSREILARLDAIPAILGEAEKTFRRLRRCLHTWRLIVWMGFGPNWRRLQERCRPRQQFPLVSGSLRRNEQHLLWSNTEHGSKRSYQHCLRSQPSDERSTCGSCATLPSYPICPKKWSLRLSWNGVAP